MNTETGQVKGKYYLLLLAQAFLLCYIGFYNNYPMVYPDTGTYIRSGFELYVPYDRPILYGLLIRLLSLGHFLWLVPLVQGFLLAWVLLQYFRVFGKAHQSTNYSFLYLFLILLCSGASFHVSQLIPDIFTPIMLLSLGLLLFAEKLNRQQKVGLYLLTVISIAVHNSHLVSSVLLLLLFSLLAWWQRKKEGIFSIELKRLRVIWLLIGSSLLLTSSLHYIFGRSLSLSKGSHVFQMNRLIELGILQEYLHEHCGEKDFRFCAYKDSIPFDFMWDPNSPLYKTGSWEGNEQEYKTIIRDILSTPEYMIMIPAKSIEYSFRQFFSFDTGDAPPARPGSAPYSAIEAHFKKDIRQFDLSLQNLGRLNFEKLNNRQFLFILISAFFLLLFFFHPEFSALIPGPLKAFSLFLLLALWVNCLVCGTFATVVPRYQSRVIWLLPLPLILILAQAPFRQLLFAKLKKLIKGA